MEKDQRSPIIYPLDFPTLQEARMAMDVVASAIGTVKIGLELFTREGPRAISLGSAYGHEVFLDLKLHDIPETVDRAVASAIELGVDYLTVHASGGRAMLKRAANRASQASKPLTILAVTMLTSLDEKDLLDITGRQHNSAQYTLGLAKMAWEEGVRGFICSPMEVAGVRQLLGKEAILITPGVRPANAGSDDQKRISTPHQAIVNGANKLVVGRPIKDAPDPLKAAESILAEIRSAASLPRT